MGPGAPSIGIHDRQARAFMQQFRVDIHERITHCVALETLTKREKSLAPVRSHFGDMQFLHAMAGRAGESAEETRRNILRWSEGALGEIAPKALTESNANPNANAEAVTVVKCD